MSDRELLELAAKAAGYNVDYFEGEDFDNPHLLVDNGTFMLGDEFWMPLEDDEQSEALAEALGMLVQAFTVGGREYVNVSILNDKVNILGVYSGVPGETRRKAVLKIAAEIGRAMP